MAGHDEINTAPVVVDHHEDEVDVETKDRGLLDYFGKKKEKVEEVIVTEFEEKVQVSEAKVEPEKEVGEDNEKKIDSLVAKLHHSNSSSTSSSSDEEEKEGKKKKKEKEKEKDEEDTMVPIEKYEEEEEEEEEEKGFIEKVKEILPGSGGHKKAEEEEHEYESRPPLQAEDIKKGFFQKIKEKLPPGYHSKKHKDKV